MVRPPDVSSGGSMGGSMVTWKMRNCDHHQKDPMGRIEEWSGVDPEMMMTMMVSTESTELEVLSVACWIVLTPGEEAKKEVASLRAGAGGGFRGSPLKVEVEGTWIFLSLHILMKERVTHGRYGRINPPGLGI
jgi:hypothetical protein